MFNKASYKVKFQDQQLDDYILENSVLKSKLQSKIDALSIMSKELDKCSMERDRYKVLVEQFKCKNVAPLKTHGNDSNIYKFTPTNTISCSDILAKTRDHNNMLKIEVEILRSNLEDATKDIEALRKQLQKNESTEEIYRENKKNCNQFTCSNKDYEQLLQDLEKNKKKYQQIQVDYRASLDEKEELITDREYYKSKVQRLNHQISYILLNRVKGPQIDAESDPPKPIVDIDALVTENKYLHERISQLQIEKEIIKRTLSKYKTLLDNRNNYQTQFKKGFNDVMTQKQAREFLDNNTKTGSKENSAAELKSLSLGLFEALNDKSIALQHQRKTNQILANRIAELERTLESWCNGEKYIPTFPSQMLIDEFLPDTASTKSVELKDKSSNESRGIPESNRCKYYDSDGEDKEQNNEYSDADQVHDSLRLFDENRNGSKIVLPQELEELVKEARAELKPVD